VGEGGGVNMCAFVCEFVEKDIFEKPLLRVLQVTIASHRIML